MINKKIVGSGFSLERHNIGLKILRQCFHQIRAKINTNRDIMGSHMFSRAFRQLNLFRVLIGSQEYLCPL